MSEFIFMLTRDDVTLADARAVYASIADSGVTHVGCKDVGLPREELAEFMDEIRANGHTSYLEVVAESDEATLASARVAAEVRPDYCIGGTLIPEMQEILAGTGVKFFPYVGQIVGPSVPAARLDRRDRRRHEARRTSSASTASTCSPTATTATSTSSSRQSSRRPPLPVICAGSVDSAERIRALASRGVWAFTIGTAALDGVLVPGAPLGEQLDLALSAA